MLTYNVKRIAVLVAIGLLAINSLYSLIVYQRLLNTIQSSGAAFNAFSKIDVGQPKPNGTFFIWTMLIVIGILLPVHGLGVFGAWKERYQLFFYYTIILCIGVCFRIVSLFVLGFGYIPAIIEIIIAAICVYFALELRQLDKPVLPQVQPKNP